MIDAGNTSKIISKTIKYTVYKIWIQLTTTDYVHSDLEFYRGKYEYNILNDITACWRWRLLIYKTIYNPR